MSGRRPDEFEWTLQRVETARTMWAAGDTCAVIGKFFGLTKNTIVSVARRKGFPKRPSPIYVGPPKSKEPRVVRPKPVAVAVVAKSRKTVSGARVKSDRASPVERQHAAGTAARMPLTGATLPGLEIDSKPSMPVAMHTGRVSKCAWLNGTRHNYIACDAPTLGNKQYCAHHYGICYQQDVSRSPVSIGGRFGND